MPTPALGMWGSVQWVRITKEVTYGTYNSGGVDTSPATTSPVQWLILQDGNAFVMEPSPVVQSVRSASARNRLAYKTTQRLGVKGKFMFNLAPDQAVPLLAWATVFSGTNSDVMTSYTVDHWDGIEARRWLGVAIPKMSFESDADKDYCVMTAELLAQRQDLSFTTFTEGAITKYSTIRPYCHQDTAGLVTAPGVIVGYKKLTVSITNHVFSPFNESSYIQGAVYRGRDATWMISKLNLDAVQRLAFEAQTKVATGTIQYSQASPAHSLLFDFKSSSYITARGIDRGFGVSQYEDVSLEAAYDTTAGTDLAITVS